MLQHPLKVLNWSVFLQTQIFMLPITLLFYQANGLTKGDYFLFQGIFSIAALLFEVPAGYVGDFISRKKVLILSYSLFVCRLLLWLFFGGYWILLIGELLYAMSKAFFSGVADGYIYDLLKSRGQTNKMLNRYGRMNFFMSIGTAIASLLGAPLYQHYGVVLLLLIELVFNSFAIGLLLFLPSVPPIKRQIMGIKEKYLDLIHITVSVFKNEKLKYYVCYSGMVVATTMIFVWSFQPLMQTAAIPVALFGVVYFINHFFRAGASLFLEKTMRICNLKSLGVGVYSLFILAFGAAIAMLHVKSIYVNFALLAFICFVIGTQLTFTLASISRLHGLVSSDVRSTVASVNTMFSRMATGVVLILFKFLLDGVSMQNAFLIYFVLFLTSIYPLMKLLKQPSFLECDTK